MSSLLIARWRLYIFILGDATTKLCITNYCLCVYFCSLVMSVLVLVINNLNIDGFQQGLGSINSWGRLPLETYRLPYKDYKYTYWMMPVEN
mgnify:CR=1 FL=1